MSDSPVRRFSTASPTNHLKARRDVDQCVRGGGGADHQRVVTQIGAEKIQLENALEAESESHVNRLNRELCALRAQAHASANATGTPGSTTASGASSPESARAPFLSGHDPTAPSVDVMLEAMRRENEQLRTRLVDTERDYVRISRLNDIYREELLELRRRWTIWWD
ncbi:hypothetical protein J3R82DRAFT_6467 [Butyriboletus roseoflavus]|nr:hypothetical protein J3R82DRAFT_6467 [Butyriboletus roseoflavus]